MKLAIAILALLASGFAQTDGPATLPVKTMAVAMASTPAPNPPKIIGATDNLQTALNGAVCGDTFQVDPAWTGFINLPSLACDAEHWIVITSSGPLPPEGQRIKPGAALPKIVITVSNASVKGGIFVRLVGFEVTRLPNTGVVYNLINPSSGAHDIIYDRCYIHGTPTDETVRGVFLSNASNVAVIDSYLSDFHCLSIIGSCGDAQTITGGLDAVQSGNYLIQNNYLEASGEGIIFGGGPSSFVPTDITVRWNDFNKPDSWNPNDPTYTPIRGHAWIVKNFFEMKNGKRVLLEGNRMTGNWGGFSQQGFGILLTPKSQGNVCLACLVEDVTIRNNWISKSEQAMQLAYVPSDNGFWAVGGGRWSIHDNIFDHLHGQWLVQLNTLVSPTGAVLHDITVDRNTFLVDQWARPGGFILLGGPVSAPQMNNIQYTNNVQFAGTYPVYSVGGGTTNCASVHLFKPDIITACWTGTSAFTGNVILYTGNPPRGIPPGNSLVPAGANIDKIVSALANRKP